MKMGAGALYGDRAQSSAAATQEGPRLSTVESNSHMFSDSEQHNYGWKSDCFPWVKIKESSGFSSQVAVQENQFHCLPHLLELPGLCSFTVSGKRAIAVRVLLTSLNFEPLFPLSSTVKGL